MEPTYKQSSYVANCTPCMPTCDKRKCERVHICNLNNLHSEHTATLLPLSLGPPEFPPSARGQTALWQPNADDCKYKEGAVVRLTASIIEQKGPQSVCLPLWRASRLAGLAAHQYYRCHGQPQQLLAGLLKPAPGCQPAACLLYTINLCSLEMVQGCGEAPRHNCPARLPKLRQQWGGRGESAGARNEWRGRMRMEPWRKCKL